MNQYISDDIPALECQVEKENAAIQPVAEEVEQNKSRVARAKVATRDLQTLKSAASLVSRTLAEVRDLKTDIARLERDLEASGSLKTVEDVQREMDSINIEV
jgi:DNA repair protein RAD50